MPYEDVKATCHFCDATIEGNQRFMLGGKQLPALRGRISYRLRAKPEHQWVWNGLSAKIGEKIISFDFYLCPKHNDQEHVNKAFKWAQEQIEGQKALASLIV